MVKAKQRFLSLLLGIFIGGLAFGQKLTVKIIDRQNSETDYSYVVPGRSTANSNSNVNCFGTGNNVNCNGTTNTVGTNVPAQQVPYHVRGATFSLLLPDGRIAVVNCESKFAERFSGPRGNRRSCRMPIVDDIQAEFDGDKAKLSWPVSLDGRKWSRRPTRSWAFCPSDLRRAPP